MSPPLTDPLLDDPLIESDSLHLAEKLRAARAARGWTQAQAAKALGVARTTMTAIEKGERRVRPDELVKLAEMYGRKVSTLLRRGEPLHDLSHRLRDVLGTAEVDSEIERGVSELQRLLADYAELERLGDIRPLRETAPVYPLGSLDPERVAEEAAVAERNRLALGDGPVLNLRDVVEIELGLRVFYLDLPATVRALYAHGEEQGGLVGINRRLSPERRRAALAHVYGCFSVDRHRPRVLRTDSYERRPVAERFAEAFGRALLAPGQGVRRRFHEMLRQRQGSRDDSRPIAGDVFRLAHHFFVSTTLMAQRLEDLRLIPGGSRRRLDAEAEEFLEIASFLGLPERPADDEVLPTRYRYLVMEAWQRGDLTEGQLASFLRTDRVSARRIIGGFELSSIGLSTPLTGAATS